MYTVLGLIIAAVMFFALDASDLNCLIIVMGGIMCDLGRAESPR